MTIIIILYTVTVQMMTMDLSTNENDGDTIIICAEAVNVTQFEVEATVEMMITGDSQTSTMNHYRLSIVASACMCAWHRQGCEYITFCINIVAEKHDIILNPLKLTATMEDIMAPGGTTATFQMGDAAPACINITVIDDDCFEGDHQFTVMLTNPSPSTIVIDPNDDDVTVTITDSNGN